MRFYKKAPLAVQAQRDQAEVLVWLVPVLRDIAPAPNEMCQAERGRLRVVQGYTGVVGFDVVLLATV